VIVDAESPREEVDTHRVEVPVDWRIRPSVPDAAVESRNSPESERLVALIVGTVSPPVDDAFVKVSAVAVSPVVEALLSTV
jgi:hypothetical protein